jgi:TPR repeat protein
MRAAEIRDEILFRQPESSHVGDCPICCLPLPLDGRKVFMSPCCAKRICIGCNFANVKRESQASQKDNKCAFCRTAFVATVEEQDLNLMKRVKVNDPSALFKMGVRCQLRRNYESAFEYYTKASGLGDATSHCNLGHMYLNGEGVENNEKMATYHLEEAAIGGHPGARHALGHVEVRKGRVWRAIKHWIIAAHLGDDASLEQLKKGYKGGLVSKEDFALALRAHKDVVDETKSKQREEAEAANFYSRSANSEDLN